MSKIAKTAKKCKKIFVEAQKILHRCMQRILVESDA